MEEKDLNYIKVCMPDFLGASCAYMDIDDQRGRASDCQQPKLWLSIQSDCLLPSEPAH